MRTFSACSFLSILCNLFVGTVCFCYISLPKAVHHASIQTWQLNLHSPTPSNRNFMHRRRDLLCSLFIVAPAYPNFAFLKTHLQSLSINSPVNPSESSYDVSSQFPLSERINQSKYSPTWRDYLDWIPPDATASNQTTDNIPIEDLPIKELVVDNRTIQYRQASDNSPKYIDIPTYNQLLQNWDPKELEKIRNENYHDYNIPPGLPADSWIPFPQSLEKNNEIKLIKVDTETEGYDYIHTYYDSRRNYTWSYKRYNPYKIGNQSILPFEPWKCETFEDQRYYLQNVSLPPKTLDTDIFRQPPLANMMTAGMSSTPADEQQWKYIPINPFGVGPTYQKFWELHSIKKNKDRNPEMRFLRLGKSDLIVSEICLGTMTFGLQVDETRAHALLDYCYDEFNVNFFDTSELYPLPARPSHHGKAEIILGNWIKKRGKEHRERLIIATKIAGRTTNLPWLRSEQEGRDGSRGTCLSKSQIHAAVDASLHRLQTDYLDLLQFHWPDRYVPLQESADFGDILFDSERMYSSTISMHEQLEAIQELIQEGKIRAWGLSNETPWGVLRFWELAKEMGMAEAASLQVHYNLLCRNDVEKSFVELCRPNNTGIGILAYSPLAGGILTGKYLEHLEYPTTGRMLRFPSYMKRLRGSLAARAIREYHDLAIKNQMKNLAMVALRWVYSRPFVCSTIIGATDLLQLRENLWCTNDAISISDLIEREINALHWKWRDPLRIIQ
ncbi:aldo-keto reductase [Cardiosporidium cionae]|uniref:Aldo-keto reductase n=1 Tax=Cardiosporidium cionae TaxID=476202 RepID=A0ABQ7J7S0_9APIC|nr:aldo-keto reductase [Cardiosporidium cionae]|eukprot:KAF8820041.1 aldo-keto reductase [Cardiosporidium cionae]